MKRVGTRIQVMNGTAKQTGGGLRKRDLIYNKRGKIVSKKMSSIAKKRMQKGGTVETVEVIKNSKNNTKIVLHRFNKLTKTNNNTNNTNNNTNYVEKIYYKDKSQTEINKTKVKTEKIILGQLYDTSNPRSKNIVKILDNPTTNFLKLELLEGSDLKRLLMEKNFKFKLKDALKIMTILAETIKYIHDKGYIHLDIKTENICFRKEISNETIDNYNFEENIVLIDFETAMNKVNVEDGTLEERYEPGINIPITVEITEPELIKKKYPRNFEHILKQEEQEQQIDLKDWERAKLIDVYSLGMVFSTLYHFGIDESTNKSILNYLCNKMTEIDFRERFNIDTVISELEEISTKLEKISTNLNSKPVSTQKNTTRATGTSSSIRTTQPNSNSSPGRKRTRGTPINTRDTPINTRGTSINKRPTISKRPRRSGQRPTLELLNIPQT